MQLGRAASRNLTPSPPMQPPLLDDGALDGYAVVHAVPTLGGEHDARWKGLLLAL
jgi:hypothetical protein